MENVPTLRVAEEPVGSGGQADRASGAFFVRALGAFCVCKLVELDGGVLPCIRGRVPFRLRLQLALIHWEHFDDGCKVIRVLIDVMRCVRGESVPADNGSEHDNRAAD